MPSFPEHGSNFGQLSILMPSVTHIRKLQSWFNRLKSEKNVIIESSLLLQLPNITHPKSAQRISSDTDQCQQ